MGVGLSRGLTLEWKKVDYSRTIMPLFHLDDLESLCGWGDYLNYIMISYMAIDINTCVAKVTHAYVANSVNNV